MSTAELCSALNQLPEETETGKPAKSWREIAERLARETDRDKIADLSQELLGVFGKEKAKKKSA